MWMSYFYCHLLSLVLCPIDLTYRSRCDWLFLEVLEYVLDIFTIRVLEILFSGFKRVSWSMFSQILELMR